MQPGESSCPDGSEYVWQRGVESLQGQVTAARSWPLFREKKNHLRRCYKKLGGHNSDFGAKSSWEKIFNIYKNFLSGGFRSKVKIVTPQLFVTPPYFCWQLAFYRHLPTSGRQNTVKTAPQPLFVNSESISVHLTRRQIFAGKPYSTFPNIWEWLISVLKSHVF